MEIKLAFSKKPLREAVASYNEDASVRKAFFEAGNSISSDGDHQQELVSLAQKQGIGADTLAGVTNSAHSVHITPSVQGGAVTEPMYL